MSLATDIIFIASIKSDETLMESIAGRLYGTAIPLPDEDADNVPVPYIIVTFNGLTNEQGTKDEPYESDYDNVNIGIEVTGRTLEELHTLTDMVRATVLQYMQDNDTPIADYTFSAEAIRYDSDKPCYWQVLTYQCEIDNTIEYEQD